MRAIPPRNQAIRMRNGPKRSHTKMAVSNSNMLSLVDDESHSSLEIIGNHNQKEDYLDSTHLDISPSKKKKMRGDKRTKKDIHDEVDFDNNVIGFNHHSGEDPEEIFEDEGYSNSTKKRKKSKNDKTCKDNGISHKKSESWPNACQAATSPRLSSVSLVSKEITPRESTGRRVDVDSMISNLTMGVESNDTDMIDSVILLGNEEVVVKEVMNRMPVSIVIPLLKILKKMVSRRSVNTALHLFWLQHLIQRHLTFLLSVGGQGLKTELMKLIENLNIRIEVFDRVLKLKGRLNLLMSQVKEVDDQESHDASSTRPIIVYQDSDDSEDEELVEENVSESFYKNQQEMQEEEGTDVEEQDFDRDEDGSEEDIDEDMNEDDIEDE